MNWPFATVVTPPANESETVVTPFTTVIFKLDDVAFV
jgi:hypothetical protein